MVCLSDLLDHSPSLLASYKDYLVDSMRKGDSPTKRQILKIFESYANSEELEEIVGELLHLLDGMEKGYKQ